MKTVAYRPPNPDDLAFITSSWLKSNRNSDFANFIDNKSYYKLHADLIKDILTRSLVTIICDIEAPDHIYGYAVYELLNNNLVLHYIYIKFNYRNFGLAKDCLTTIFPDFGTKDIHLTHIDQVKTRIIEDGKDHLAKKTSCFIKKRDKYKLLYNPYLLVSTR